MSSSPTSNTHSSNSLDILVVGAGISGISAAYYLKQKCPNHSFALLEGRKSLGGTWDLFRYPGVRSDTDMHTLGFSFRPWTEEKTMGDGALILQYLEDTATEFDINKHIRYNHHVVAANWSSRDANWVVKVDHNGKPLLLTCKFLFMCSGYFDYKGGHRPNFQGEENFKGDIIHPQEWPEDFDCQNKKVVVIGSGATAVTLVPSLAHDANHVTMLQRSATYVSSWPSVDRMAKLMFLLLPARLAHYLARIKNTLVMEMHYKLAMRWPKLYKRALLCHLRRELGGKMVQSCFNPSYSPWEQRVCLVPDGDFFEAIRSGKASVVTDTISSFTENGVELNSGSKLEADIVVTATGLQMVSVGGSDMEFTIDGKPIDFSSLWSYKGVAYSGVPNLAANYFSYVSKSWTLRAELTSQWVCKLLNHMEGVGAQVCEPSLHLVERSSMAQHPFITGFSPGYMQRMMPKLPKQGNCAPWVRSECYRTECKWLLTDPCDDGTMIFFKGATAATNGSRNPRREWVSSVNPGKGGAGSTTFAPGGWKLAGVVTAVTSLAWYLLWEHWQWCHPSRATL